VRCIHMYPCCIIFMAHALVPASTILDVFLVGHAPVPPLTHPLISSYPIPSHPHLPIRCVRFVVLSVPIRLCLCLCVCVCVFVCQVEALESPAVSLAEASAAQTSDISDPTRDGSKGAAGQAGQGQGGQGPIQNIMNG
jgi:hypothetical protein